MYVGSSDCGCDVLERARLFAGVVWAVKVVLGCVFKLRLEAWDDISSSMAVFESRAKMPNKKNSTISRQQVPLVDSLRRNSSHEESNPQKRSPPWQSRTPGLAAWLWC